jgi:uncharacterized protein (DUF362 family)
MRRFFIISFLFLFQLGLKAQAPASHSAVMPATSAVPPSPIMRGNLPTPSPVATPAKSDVYFALNPNAVGPGMEPRFSYVSRMVQALVCAVTGKPTPDEAWRSLVKRGERVGIKVAAQPGVIGGTHPQVVKAVVDGLIAAGIPSGNIIVWDRRREDLVACGYDRTPGLNLRWIEQGEGYDPRAVVTTSAIGQLVYGDLSFRDTRSSLADILGPQTQLSNESHLPVVLSRDVDKVINIPSLCDSFYTGINGALAGMTIGILDNWRRFGKGQGYGATALADVYSDDRIGKKVVLTMMDAMILQYAGGPAASPVNCISYGMLIASKDPVAVDSSALRLIDEQRDLSRMPKASEDAGHLEEAADKGLGNNDPKMITLKRIGAPSPGASLSSQ